MAAKYQEIYTGYYLCNSREGVLSYLEGYGSDQWAREMAEMGVYEFGIRLEPDVDEVDFDGEEIKFKIYVTPKDWERG